MKEQCLVKRIGENFSGCLVDPPECRFAMKIGFSFHCGHPEHHWMAVDTLSNHRGEDLAQRYRDLRERRRQQLVSQLGMPLEECLQKILCGMTPRTPDEAPGVRGDEVMLLFAR